MSDITRAIGTYLDLCETDPRVVDVAIMAYAARDLVDVYAGRPAYVSFELFQIFQRIADQSYQEEEARFTAYDYGDALANPPFELDMRKLCALDDAVLFQAVVELAEYKRSVYSDKEPETVFSIDIFKNNKKETKT